MDALYGAAVIDDADEADSQNLGSDEDEAAIPKRQRSATVQVACEPCRKKARLKLTERKKRGPKPGSRMKRKVSDITGEKEEAAKEEPSSAPQNESSSADSSSDKDPASPEPLESHHSSLFATDDAEQEPLVFTRELAKRRYQAPLIVPHTVLTELSSLRTYMEGYRKSVWPACLSPPRPVETILDSTDSWETSCAYATLALGARTQGNLAHAYEFIQKACLLINAEQDEKPHFMRLAALNAISFFYKSNCDFATALHYNHFARDLAQHLLINFPDAEWPQEVNTDVQSDKMIHIRHLCLEAICSALTMGNEGPTMSAQLLMFIAPVLARYNKHPHDLLFDRFVKGICVMPMIAMSPIDELHKVEEPLTKILSDICDASSFLDASAVVVRWLVIFHGMMALIHLLRGNREESLRHADVVTSLLVQKGPAFFDMNTCVAMFWVAQVHMRLDYTLYTWDQSILSEMAKFAKMAFFISGYLRILEHDLPLFNEVPFSVSSIPLHIYPPDAASLSQLTDSTSSRSSSTSSTDPMAPNSPTPSQMPLSVPPKPLDDREIQVTISRFSADPRGPIEFQQERVAVIQSAASQYLAVYNSIEPSSN